MTYISSPVNPTVKYYNSLSRSKVRARDGVFVIEGDILVRESIQADIQIVSAMIDESRMHSIEDIVKDLEQKNVPVYMASAAAMARASSLDTPQNIIAVGHVPQSPQSMDPNGRYMVCEGLQNPGNAGAILRSAAAFGIDGVIFVGSCDIYSVKVLRGSMGAVYKVPVYVYSDVEQVADMLHQHKIRSYAAVVGESAKPLSAVDLGDGCAIWIGNEGNGLSREAIDFCENKVYIPMRQNTESLNASVAASIFMWEMSK